MILRTYSHLFFGGLLASCISPMLCGATPQGRHQQTPTSQQESSPSPASGGGSNPGSGFHESGGFRGEGARGGVVPSHRHAGNQQPTSEPAPLPQPISHRLPPGTGSVVFNQSFEPCKTMPDITYWRRRNHDVFEFILMRSRSSFIPAVAFPSNADRMQGTSIVGVGWRAYGFFVPPGGQIRATLDHPNKGWFSLYLTNKWGNSMPGAFRRLGEPEVTYKNDTSEVKAIYVIVDDPGLWATEGSPYMLTLNRSFDPTQVSALNLKIAQGIWN